MRVSKSVALSILALLSAAAASASNIDMDDPRRALGRENDIRIDAQLIRDTVSPGVPIGITYQIQNLTTSHVAIADKVASASYDMETRTITVSIGSETPQDNLPRMITVKPGEKKVLQASATPSLTPAAMRTTNGGAPRYVQVKVSILREVGPFRTLIENQERGPQPITDELFDKWFECNDTILLNSVPVQFSPRNNRLIDAERRHMHASF
jgi:hypothetical protein